jgi:GxxExxY protein
MYDDIVYKINGCLFTVYNTLGNVWQEEVYEKALHIEIQAQGLKAERQKEFQVFYFDKQVGQYRIDLLVEENIVVELKAVPEVFPLHQAQLISYLKGYNKPLGILANLGQSPLYYRIFPNKLSQKTALRDEFEIENVQIPGKERIKYLLVMATRILVTLGPGYFHQVYRRAWYHELQSAGVEFEIIKEVVANYRQQVLGTKEVNFFRIGDLLLSAIAVNELTNVLGLKFRHYIKHLNCQRGLIVNFRALHLDCRYFEL